MIITNNRVLALSSIAVLLAGCSPSSDLTVSGSVSDYKGSASITQGLAKTVEENLFECANGRSRVAGIGEIADASGKVWTVPAQNHFTTAPKAVDLYEECANITPESIADVDEDSVP
ncbi:hypothetical protein ERJ77_23985, partial [Vibrio anguillarum]|nr:hypothetical protein [Vibrio anguillarum]